MQCDILGRSKRASPARRAEGHRNHDAGEGRSRICIHPGPYGDRRHRIDHRSSATWLAAAQPPGTTCLQCHTAGLRITDHPASALVQRWTDHIPRSTETRADAQRAPPTAEGAPDASALSMLSRARQSQRSGPAARAVRQQLAESMGGGDCVALLRAVRARPAPVALPLVRTSPGVRIGTDAAARQHGRRSSVAPANRYRQKVGVRKNTQGREPNTDATDSSAVPIRFALRDWRDRQSLRP